MVVHELPPTAPSSPSSPCSTSAAAFSPLVLLAVVAGGLALAGCLRPDRDTLTVEEFARERSVRERTHAKIEADHAALTALIASDRFEDPEVIYGDPELRALALHLIEQSRKLERLADSDVLAPGAPDAPDAPNTSDAPGAP